MATSPRGGLAQRLRDVGLIARFELLESVRTRRVLVLVLLFLLGGGFSAWGFASFLGNAEAAAAHALNAPSTNRPGASLSALEHTSIYRDLVKSLVDDPQAAAALAAIPPIVLVFAWLTMTFAPALVLLTSSDAVSAEIETRSLRYTLLRTGRVEYAAGKLAGQLALLAAVLLLSGITFLTVSAISLSGLSLGDSALAMLRLWPWIFADTLPYVGLALGASMLASSGRGGWALSIGGVVLLSLAHVAAQWPTLRHGGIAPALLDLLDYTTPFPRRYGLIAPVGPTFFHALAVTLGTFAAYTGLGLWRFRRRDL